MSRQLAGAAILFVGVNAAEDASTHKAKENTQHGSAVGKEYVGKFAPAYQKYLAQSETGKESYKDYVDHYVDQSNAHSDAGRTYQERYASQYTQGVSGKGKSGGQDYIDKFAGRYKEYMKKAGSTNYAAANGDFEDDASGKKYIEKYAKNASTGHAEGKKYIDKYDSKKYIDKYAKQATTDFNSTDYKKYAHEYADKYQKDEKPWQKYMDKYAHKYEKYVHSSGDDFKDYYQKHASEFEGKGGYEKYYQKYQKYMDGINITALQLEANDPTVPKSAKDCETKDDLNKWLNSEKAKIHDSVPAAYRHFAYGPLRAAYDRQLAKLNGDPEPKEAPSDVTDCHSKEDLDAWKASQLSSIHEFVPKAYQHFPEKILNKEYKNQLDAIEQAAKAATATTTTTTANLAKTESSQPIVAEDKAAGAVVDNTVAEAAKDDADSDSNTEELHTDSHLESKHAKDTQTDGESKQASTALKVKTQEKTKQAFTAGKVHVDAAKDESEVDTLKTEAEVKTSDAEDLSAISPTLAVTTFTVGVLSLVTAVTAGAYQFLNRRRIRDESKEAPFLRMAHSV